MRVDIPHPFSLALGLCGLYAVLVGALLVLGSGTGAVLSYGWAAGDQGAHIEQINYLIAHPFTLLHYPAAAVTTPGFHLLVAWIADIAGLPRIESDTWLRLVPFLLGLGVLGVLWRLLAALSEDIGRATLLCLPVLLSKYFLLPSAFLVTENAAYLGYVILLMAYLRFPQRGLAIGFAGAGLVFTRQIFLPVIATQLLAQVRALVRRPADSHHIGAVLLGMLPPIVVASAYFWAWGGPVPPGLGNQVHIPSNLPNLDAVIEAWALLGLLAIPYALLAYPGLRALRGKRFARLLCAAAATAVLLWLSAPSGFEPGTHGLPGRWGSAVWIIARFSPLIEDHAILVLPCLVLGFMAAAVIVESAWERGTFPAELAMFATYTAALSMQAYSFERYTEVAALVTLSVASARLPIARGPATWIFLAAYSAKLPLSLTLPG